MQHKENLRSLHQRHKANVFCAMMAFQMRSQKICICISSMYISIGISIPTSSTNADKDYVVNNVTRYALHTQHDFQLMGRPYILVVLHIHTA